MAPAVGIDLGTTYSAVVWITADGRPEVIPDEAGEPLGPSVVSLAAGAPIVGAAAKEDQSRGEHDVAAFFKSSMED
jgi:molecular chaperone DnaK